MAECVEVYGGEAAPLSFGVLAGVCAFPTSAEAQRKAFCAMASILENQGAVVREFTHGGVLVRRAAWRDMSPAARDQIVDRVAHRLVMRRLPAVDLLLLRGLRPAGMTMGDLLASRAHGLRRVSERLGRYRRGFGDASARNVEQLVWRESWPVLHVAAALKAELERLDLSAWDWPLLGFEVVGGRTRDPAERLRHVVADAARLGAAFRQPLAPVGGGIALAEAPDGSGLRVSIGARVRRGPTLAPPSAPQVSIRLVEDLPKNGV